MEIILGMDASLFYANPLIKCRGRKVKLIQNLPHFLYVNV